MPSGEQHAPGARVQLVVQIKDEKLGTALECTVLLSTSQGPLGQAGLYVELSAEQQDKARDFLGLKPTTDLPARAEVRVDCQLPARLLSPAVSQVFHTRNISRNGLLASCATPLESNQLVQVAVELNANETLQVRCKVAWVRPELNLVGLRFEGLSLDELLRLDAVVAAFQSPAAGKPNSAAPAASGGAGPGAGASPLAPLPDLGGRPDVLIADDEPSVALFVQRIATKLGLKVVTFDRGDTALKAIRTQRPRLVMLDVLMPGLDGLQVCSLVRADAMLARTPIILLSALEAEKVRKIAEEAKATAWLQKPLDLHAVRRVIRDAVATTEEPETK